MSFIKRRLLNPATLAAAAFAVSSAAFADTQVWQQTNSDDNWNTTATNWDAGVLWANDNDAIFGDTGEAITLGSGISANNLTFGVTGYSIASDTLTLTGVAPTVTVTNSGDIATLGSVISGSNGLSVAGAGTLVLTGANTYTGGTAIASGSTLRLGTGGALGDGAIVNNGNLVFNQAANIAVPAATLSGTGNLSVTSTTGTVTVSSALNQGGDITLNAFTNTTVTANITAGGALSIQPGNGNSSGLGLTGVTLKAASIDLGVTGIGNNGTFGTGTLTLDTSAANGNISIGGDIGRNGNVAPNPQGGLFGALVVKAGTGTITLSAAKVGYIGNLTNTFTGNVILANDTVFCAKDTSYTHNGNYVVGSSATFNNGVDVQGHALQGGLGPDDPWGLFANPGTLTFKGNVTDSVGGGVLSTGTSNLVFDTTGTQAVGVVIASTSGITVGLSSGTGTRGSITKTGAGTTTFTGTNTYTGATKISAGILSVGTIGNGGVAGNLGAATNAAANLVLDGGTLQYTGATASTDRAFTITAAKTGTIDISNAGTNLTISGAAANTTGALTKAGLGTLTLTGANLHTGATIVKNGVLALSGGDNRLSASTALTLGDTGTSGKLVLGDTSAKSDLTVAGLTSTGLAGSIVGGFTSVSTLTVNLATGTNTYAGVLGGVGTNENNLAFVKSGAGTLILSGNNTFTGMTTISGGTLQLNAVNALKSANAITFAGNNATLLINVAGVSLGALTVNTGITGANISFTQNTSTYSQTIAGATLGSALTINQSGTTGNNWNQISWSSKITGGTAAGADALIFNNTSGTQNYFTTNAGVVHDFTGNVHVKAGVVAVQGGTSNGVVPDASMIIVDSGATWRWNGAAFTETVDGLSGAGAITTNAGSYNLTINANNAANDAARVFSGSMANPASAVILGGTGTQEFSGTGLNYSAGTNLNNGTLKLTNTTAWNSAVVLGGANTPKLQLNGTTGSWTFGKVISGGSANAIVEKTGAGTVTLSVANSYAGTTRISGGTLIAGVAGAFGSSAVQVNTDGTLNVNGLTLANAMAFNGGTLTGAAGSTLNGAVTIGASGVNIASGANLVLNGNVTLATGAITTDGAGLFANSGTLTLGGSGVLDLGGAFDGYNGGAGGTYKLISTSVTGNFANITGFGANWSSVTFDNTTGNLQFAAVPEPGTYGLIGAGALAAVAFVRRRRRNAAGTAE